MDNEKKKETLDIQQQQQHKQKSPTTTIVQQFEAKSEKSKDVRIFFNNDISVKHLVNFQIYFILFFVNN